MLLQYNLELTREQPAVKADIINECERMKFWLSVCREWLKDWMKGVRVDKTFVQVMGHEWESTEFKRLSQMLQVQRGVEKGPHPKKTID